MVRPQKFRLTVWCIFNEKENAKQTHSSISTDLRTAGQLKPVKTDINYETVQDLTSLQGALGRVFGLL